MTRPLAGLALILLGPGLLPGQATKNPPAFEVADVHVSAPGTSSSGGFMPGGRVELRGVTMLELISAAYGVDEKMIVGGPPWLASDKFDVIAKAPATSKEEVLQAMLKTLLGDRFSLAVKQEKRDMPVYVLTAAKTAPKLQPAAKDGPPQTSQGTGDPGMIHMRCTSCSMDDLSEILPGAARNYVDHPVVNETNLKGKFDFQLDWMGRAVYLAAKNNPDGPPATSVFDGLEKLGLKLEPGKKPMDAVVVDRVNETPSSNSEGVASKIPAFPTEFEVAEVRPAKAGAQFSGRAAPATRTGLMGDWDFQNGRMEILGATLKGLLMAAYQTKEDGVSSPKWMEEDRFDVIAKAPRDIPEDALWAMLKNLLIQRFKLTVHTEEQPLTVYVLARGKRDAKLKASDGMARSECKIVFIERRNYVCTNTTMAQFAERLPTVAAAYVKPPLIDLTEIQGAYDFQLYWTPKNALPKAKAAADGEASTPSDDLTVFEAVDKQLGLKLEEQKRPMPVVMVDHAERTPIAQ